MANVGSGAAGKTLIGAGNGASPTYASIGTNSGLTTHGVLIAQGNGAFVAISPGLSGQILQATGVSSNPAYSTATYPSTTTAKQLLYSSAANTVAGLATANNGLLITSTTGVPSILANGTTGQVLTATTGSPPSWANASGGSITLTGDSGGALSGSAFTVYADTAGNNCGTTVNFSGSGTTLTLNVSDGNGNTNIGLGAGTIVGGLQNTFIGRAAGQSAGGVGCVAVGYTALNVSATDYHNTAVGSQCCTALNGGGDNTCLGANIMNSATSGGANVVIGSQTGGSMTGGNNVVIGYFALNGSSPSGGGNTLIGYSAGSNYNSTESYNILLGYNIGGTVGESNVTRIGAGGIQTACYIDGITGVTVSASSVVGINSSGQLSSLGSGTTGQILTATTSASPSFSAIGTNSGLTAHGVLLAENNSAFVATAAFKAGQHLYSATTGADPAPQYISSASVTYVPTFNSIPGMNALTGGVAAVTINTTNIWTFPQWGAYFECYNTTVATNIAPALSTTAGRGLNVDNVGAAVSKTIEITEGNSVQTKNAFVTNTSAAFYVQASVNVTTTANVNLFIVGFRKQQAYQATVITGYTDYACIGIAGTSAKIQLKTQKTSGGETLTDTTNTVSATTTVTFKVLVSSAGVVTYTINGSAPSSTASYTFTTGLTVIPFIVYQTPAGGHAEADLVNYQCGFQ